MNKKGRRAKYWGENRQGFGKEVKKKKKGCPLCGRGSQTKSRPPRANSLASLGRATANVQCPKTTCPPCMCISPHRTTGHNNLQPDRAHPEYRGFLNPESCVSWRGHCQPAWVTMSLPAPAQSRTHSFKYTQMRIINQPARFAMSCSFAKQGLQLLLGEGMSLLYLRNSG